MIVLIHPSVALSLVLGILDIPGWWVLKTWCGLFVHFSPSVMEKLPSRSWAEPRLYREASPLWVPIVFYKCPSCLYRAVTAASQDGWQKLMRWGCFPLPHWALLAITKALASWCMAESKQLRMPSQPIMRFWERKLRQDQYILCEDVKCFVTSVVQGCF